MDNEWHRVPELDQLPEGRVATAVVDGRVLCITRCGDRLGAIDNRCPHQGGPLGEGAIENGLLRCPWHGWEFDVRTCKSYCHPDRIKTKSYPVNIEAGKNIAAAFGFQDDHVRRRHGAIGFDGGRHAAHLNSEMGLAEAAIRSRRSHGGCIAA